MGHRNYINQGTSSPAKQRNIIAFVGNGFDIQALHDHGANIDTRYESFYHFLKLRAFSENNLIFQEMGRLREEGKEDWSDVEGVVGELLSANHVDAGQLGEALTEMQAQFADFLDLAIPGSLLVALGKDSMERRSAISALAGFLGDLSGDEYRELEFPKRSAHYDLYNFVFFNFNYTPLLDNYIYLDQTQFDPLPFKTVDRNFVFQANPGGVTNASIRPQDTFSSYLLTETVHPHGMQGVPRSLLFGIDTPKTVKGNLDATHRLAKPFWAQNDRRYSHLFPETELFIVFGCSLGESDRWWWRSIADVLGQESTYSGSGNKFWPEVILYWYDAGGKKTADAVRREFLAAAGRSEQYDHLKRYIRVVLFGPNQARVWLNTSRSQKSVAP